MRGMILAAGRGERMGELTRETPKPLLKVNNHYLVTYAIAAMRRAGITEIVMNVAYQADKVQEAIGDGSAYGVKIFYSVETERLETGGGIVNALPLLGNAPFMVMSADIITDFPLRSLPALTHLSHLVLVENPIYHLQGDFGLDHGFISTSAKPYFNFAGIGVYAPQLFKGCTATHFPLNKLLLPAIEKRQVTGQLYQGTWFNAGTASDLTSITDHLRSHSTLHTTLLT